MRNRLELLEQITTLEFMKQDLALFLNTHPSSKEALTKYNFYVIESTRLKEKYEINFGMLSHDFVSPYPRQWIDNPWPWENEADFKLQKGDEK